MNILKISTGMGAFIFVMALSVSAFANKSAVAIDVPSGAQKGSSVVIRLNVTHNGNNFIHHTNWVYLKVNGTEIKRWEYSWRHLPEAGNFSLEFPVVADGPLQIEAQSNCNIHGSAGVVKANVDIKQETGEK